MEKEYYRAKECAKYLGIGVSTFLRWVAEGLIAEGYKASPRVTVWKRTDLEHFMKRQPRTAHD